MYYIAGKPYVRERERERERELLNCWCVHYEFDNLHGRLIDVYTTLF